MTRVLYISGSIGLGHVWRDIAIAQELRRLNPDIDISWMAEHPAIDVLRSFGEKVVRDAEKTMEGGPILDQMIKGYKANIIDFSMTWARNFPRNAWVIFHTIEREGFDLVIGDETYDVVSALLRLPQKKKFPFVLIYDFVGFKAMSLSPGEHLKGWIDNRDFWINSILNKGNVHDKLIFIGVPEDIPNERFGFLLPNKRELTKGRVDFVGYVLPFNPKDYQDKPKIREELGYGKEPLVICSVGGTATGRLLLDLCARAYPLMRQRMPDLKMVLVCGPKLELKGIDVSDGLEVKGYVPSLYRHLAAADLCVCSGGGTTTLELTALQKPFLFFPLENYSEQDDVAGRCQRYGAGIKMRFSSTTPAALAENVLENINKPIKYPDMPLGGEVKAAGIINDLLAANLR